MSVSVVVTCFNNERYIEEALQSIYSQTFKPTEVVVIDGGSTDNTLKILKKQGKKIRFESHEGFFASHARNRGIKTTKGDWIYFLDGDDVAYPDALANLTAIAIKTKPDMVYGGFRIIEGNTEKIGYLKPYNPRLLVSQCYIHMGASLLNRKIFQKIGFFDETLHIAEEIDLLCRIALANCKVIFVPKFIMKHRHHSSSIIGRGRWKMDTPNVVNKYYDLFKKRFT